MHLGGALVRGWCFQEMVRYGVVGVRCTSCKLSKEGGSGVDVGRIKLIFPHPVNYDANTNSPPSL